MTLFLRARHRLTDSRLRFDPCAGSCFGLDRTGERMLGVAQAHADKKIARSCAHAHSYTMNLMKSFLIAPSPKCAPAIASRARSRRKAGSGFFGATACGLLPFCYPIGMRGNAQTRLHGQECVFGSKTWTKRHGK